MRRALVAIVIVSLLGVFGVGSSRAFDPVLQDYCFNPAANGYVPCSSVTTPTATVVPPSASKLLSVSSPQAGPNGTTQYLVTVTSKLTCFSLPEPTNLYALTSPGAAVFTELAPVPGGATGQEVSVLVDQNPNSPTAGTAQLSLEADNAALGVSGLTVKAVWPSEQVERIINLVPPATPTATATPYPGQPTATPTPTPSPTPTSTSTPAATATPSAATLSVQACVQPSIMNGHTLGGDFPTLYGMASPGAACTGSVLYLDGTAPPNFNGAAQTVDNSGIVSFPWSEDTTAGGGIARVSCQLGPLTAAACTGFLVLQTGDTGLSAAQRLALLEQIQSMVSDPAQCANFFGV
jgi:hypothetical protein